MLPNHTPEPVALGSCVAFFPGEKETLLKLVCEASSHIKDMSHSVFKCLKRLHKFFP